MTVTIAKHLSLAALAALVSLGGVHGGESPARLEDLGFIPGLWQGEWKGGLAEEHWSAPEGDSMMGMFRYVQKGKAVFYEFMLIEQSPSGPSLKLKHFNPGLRGWEEKDHALVFRLTDLAEGRAVFQRDDGGSRLTFHRTTEDGLSIILESLQDGRAKTEEFRLRRAR